MLMRLLAPVLRRPGVFSVQVHSDVPKRPDCSTLLSCTQTSDSFCHSHHHLRGSDHSQRHHVCHQFQQGSEAIHSSPKSRKRGRETSGWPRHGDAQSELHQRTCDKSYDDRLSTGVCTSDIGLLAVRMKRAMAKILWECEISCHSGMTERASQAFIFDTLTTICSVESLPMKFDPGDLVLRR